MAENYKQTSSFSTIQRLSDGAFIPTDPGNRDFQDYLKWIMAGNQILPPDPVAAPVKTLSIDDLADLLVSEGVVTQEKVDGKKK